MLEQNIAVITGATKNTGLGIAGHFSRLGADVLVNGPTERDVSEAVANLESNVGTETGRRFLPAPADVSREEDVVGMFEHVRRTTGRPDVLVNARGYFLCAQEAGRLMRETNVSGAIVQIGSITATRAVRDRIAYIASKRAIESMTRAMAAELAEPTCPSVPRRFQRISPRRWRSLPRTTLARLRAPHYR